MWLEIFLIPFIILIVIYFIFWLVHEGTRWQKHSRLGVFARFIQASPKRGFLVFFLLFILIIPASMLIMSGQWIDSLQSEIGPQRVGVVNVMLILFLVLAFTFPIMYSSLGRWRNAKRAEAEMKVRPTGM
jgi:hypothetical protein